MPTLDFIPITRPAKIDYASIESALKEVVLSGMITNGKYVRVFEEKLASLLKVPHVVCVSSCTSGLMLCMRALELKGEVILPSFTFMATATAVRWCECKPVFVDVDPNTWSISPKSVSSAITSDTVAILGVHLFGNPADVESLQEIANKHSLPLIFDSAHGLGGKAT